MRDIIAHRIAGSLLALEGIGLLVLVGWQVVALAGGDTGILTTALALLVLTLAGAAIVLAFAGATWRRVSWGRSGGIVTQLLILAVALGAATGAYAQPFSALLLAAPGVVVLVALIWATRTSAPPEASDGDAGPGA
ncbi:histidine kinase [Microbacterium sp. ET2]|uniref:histidine kinase n=1 Tax=Microbacterium albipurpureum TaxID=3050384 RepID=UPI00259D2D76|nr:histidine kinase [Microbacterium sp. ET2 (Ac-2212)]WJL95146.1 histidine kinase [Microbacterium sp. ET2 (Ac-2212)]